MKRLSPLLVIAILVSACITVPPEETPEEGTRRATATVDDSGKVIQGGNLVLAIPPGALNQGQKILVTIDLILGAPVGHVSEAYLVRPEGQHFNTPVTVSYRYAASDVEGVTERSAMFLGVAEGSRWLPLADASNDVVNMTVLGTVDHFSVFGLVDPNAIPDAGGGEG